MPEVTYAHNKLNTVRKIKEFKRKEYVILYNLSIWYYLACGADNCHYVYHILWWAKFVNYVSLKMSDLKDSIILK